METFICSCDILPEVCTSSLIQSLAHLGCFHFVLTWTFPTAWENVTVVWNGKIREQMIMKKAYLLFLFGWFCLFVSLIPITQENFSAEVQSQIFSFLKAPILLQLLLQRLHMFWSYDPSVQSYRDIVLCVVKLEICSGQPSVKLLEHNCILRNHFYWVQ